MTQPIERATRFPLRLELRFRPVGSLEWHAGTTENISRTGVLFRTSSRATLGEAIEMEIALRAGLTRQTANCRGYVARTSDLADGGRRLIAATIVEHAIVATAIDPVPDMYGQGSPQTPH